MTINSEQVWLTPKQVAEAFGMDVGWVYDQIKTGKSNRAGTNGIPARMVRKTGGSIHINRAFVYPPELQPVNVVAFPQPSLDPDVLADRIIERMWQSIGERFGFTEKTRAAS